MRSFFLTEVLWSQRLKAKLISQKRIKRKRHFASSRHIPSRTHYEDVISLGPSLFGVGNLLRFFGSLIACGSALVADLHPAGLEPATL